MFLETDRADIGSDDTVGGRMSYAREIAEMDISEAAGRLGVMTSTWRAWERGRDTPRANRLFMMAGILGVTPVWLLAGRGPGPAATSTSRRSDSLATQLETAASKQRVQQIWEQMRTHAQKEDPEKRSSPARGATEAGK